MVSWPWHEKCTFTEYTQLFVTNNEVNKYLDTLATSETSLKLPIQQGIKNPSILFR